MICQHWFIDALRQQTITWANVDPDLSRYMASLGHNELSHLGLRVFMFSVRFRCVRRVRRRNDFCLSRQNRFRSYMFGTKNI